MKICQVNSSENLHVLWSITDDDEEVKMVSAHNANNNKHYNVVSDLQSDHEVKENFLKN